MTIEQVRTNYLANKRYELEPLKAFADKNTLQKADVKPAVKLEEYAQEISKIHKLDERV